VKEEKPALVPPEPKLELERSQVDVSLAAKARFSECSYFFCFASDESLETGCHSRLCSEGVARDLVYGTRCIVSTLHAVYCMWLLNSSRCVLRAPCCMLHVELCMLHVARDKLHVVGCVLNAACCVARHM
jgi:hypothetical protein